MRLIILLTLLIQISNLSADDVLDYGYQRPSREISIIATDEGFYPKNFSVFEGEKIRFFITSISEGPSCFVLAEHDLFISANRGLIAEGEITFSKAGREEFYCPANKKRGTITVLKHKRRRPSRSTASQAEQVWMPKEK